MFEENTHTSSRTPGAYFVPGPSASASAEAATTDRETTPVSGVFTPAPPIDATVEPTTEAYVVDPEGGEVQSAEVLPTLWGIEKKKLLKLSFGFGIIVAIILGITLGIIVPRSNRNASPSDNTCGPLCGDNSQVPDPAKEVFGEVCADWDYNSNYLPVLEESIDSSRSLSEYCSETYDAAAYGCGCPSTVKPTNSCGGLCKDGSELIEPKRMVRDIHGEQLSCAEWEIKSLFDVDEEECVRYNAIGAVCGCENNEPHPDACGDLCTMGEMPPYARDGYSAWDAPCDAWDTYSKFLPIWYNNENGETCSEYYHDVARHCMCPNVEMPYPQCGTLCQERRKCPVICENGLPVDDPELVVRRDSCAGWEVAARMEVHEQFCPWHAMTGAECGCKNTPAKDACGPLCGENDIPHPEKVFQGQKCIEWGFMSAYLSKDYGATKDIMGVQRTECLGLTLAPPFGQRLHTAASALRQSLLPLDVERFARMDRQCLIQISW